VESYRELIVWQKAMNLVVSVYKSTQDFPKHEVYGLVSQIQRAAVSIPSNIAEGHSLRQTPNFIRHLAIACGSLAELETQLEIARRLGYLQISATLETEAAEVGRMLTKLRTSLQSKL
jgi:four helix bundle protein